MKWGGYDIRHLFEKIKLKLGHGLCMILVRYWKNRGFYHNGVKLHIIYLQIF